jgi:cobaltochelatase CobT
VYVAKDLDTDPIWAGEVNQIVDGSGNLSREVKRYLVAMSRASTISAQRRGRIEGSRLWKNRVYGHTSDAGKRVYKDKHIRNAMDTAVTILVDQSGSMSGSKMCHAVASEVLLNDVLNSIRVKNEIIGFSHVRKSNLYIHKEFNEVVNRNELIDRAMKSVNSSLNNNADGEAILWAYERIKQRKEPKKVMIVLSDGQPAAHTPQDITGFTRNVVKRIEVDKDVEIYGIGIMDRSVQYFYKDNEVITQASQLESALLNVLKKKVISNE